MVLQCYALCKHMTDEHLWPHGITGCASSQTIGIFDFNVEVLHAGLAPGLSAKGSNGKD